MLMRVPPSSGNSSDVSTTMRPVGILLVETTAIARQAQHRLGQVGLERGEALLPFRRLPDGLDGQEGRAVTEQARVVLVARGLVDLRLPPELGLHGLHGEAVRLLAAI